MAVGTRAVIAEIPAGNMAKCPVCDGDVKFNARKKPKRIICNVYEGDRWDRMEEFHAECYDSVGRPYGDPVARSK